MSSVPKITILYVEDESSIRQSVVNSLELSGNHVISATNGQEALELLQTHPVDLVVTDIRMPKMDGLSMIQKLRQDGIDLPVIITSAFNETDYLTQAIDLKVDKFINKPIRLMALLEVIARVSESIMNKRELERKRREVERYRDAIEKTSLLMRIDVDGNIIGINQELSDYFHTQAGYAGKIETLFDILEEECYREVMRVKDDIGVYAKLTRLHLGEGIYTVDLTAFASIFGDSGVEEVTLMFRDITPVVKEKDAIIQSLYTDSLTGLPNRQKLFYDLNQAKTDKTLLIIDIDRFSRLNHLYGFERGDELLVKVSEVLKEFWPDPRPRTLYRTDADHFVIVTEALRPPDREKAKKLSEAITTRIEQTLFVLGNILRLDLSVTIGSSCGEEADLYTEASIALSYAKKNRIPFQCFSDLGSIKAEVRQNLSIQNTIKHALHNGGILNYYQPIVDRTGKVYKYEALVRMRDREDAQKIYTPFHFLDISRDSKNYSLITQRVINTAFDDFYGRQEGISLNLSFDDIVNPEISTLLEQRLSMHSGGKVTLELLESEGIKDLPKTIDFCRRMKSLGAQIAIDDFGSGYSNFVNLIDIPLDILKIDGSIVKRVDEVKVYMMLLSIVSMAKRYGMMTVAEFVEDQGIFDKLVGLEIDFYQGYHFASPKPLHELIG